MNNRSDDNRRLYYSVLELCRMTVVQRKNNFGKIAQGLCAQGQQKFSVYLQDPQGDGMIFVNHIISDLRPRLNLQAEACQQCKSAFLGYMTSN